MESFASRDRLACRDPVLEPALVVLADVPAKELRDLGLQLSIDDFGTGYSSLSYLHRLPLHTLKVDRSFVSQLDESTENLEIVRAIITLAHGLNMNVVAEGIETSAQLDKFRELKCEYAQGHWFSKAVDNATATELIRQEPQW